MEPHSAPASDRFSQGSMWGQLRDRPEIIQKVEQFLQMIPASTGSVLDVGCGDGAVTNALAERFDVTGVDLSEAALEHVQGKSLVASATDLPFADGSFDLVMCSQVLEHLEEADYRKALAELRRVARAHVLVSVPYREDLALRTIRCPSCKLRHHVWGHMRSFEVESLVADVGLEPQDIRVFGALQEAPWPKPLIWFVHHALNCHYEPIDQSPLCPRCGNTEYVGRARGMPVTAWRVKRALDRRRGAASLPFWIAVLAPVA